MRLRIVLPQRLGGASESLVPLGCEAVHGLARIGVGCELLDCPGGALPQLAYVRCFKDPDEAGATIGGPVDQPVGSRVDRGKACTHEDGEPLMQELTFPAEFPRLGGEFREEAGRAVELLTMQYGVVKHDERGDVQRLRTRLGQQHQRTHAQLHRAVEGIHRLSPDTT